jgi:hypothetical protein
LFKFTQVFLSVLTMACTINAYLTMSGSSLAANHIVEVRAATGINNFTNITTSEPTGKHTNGTALVTEGPRQIIQPKPTGNYTNGTALVTEGPRQIITGRPSTSQVTPQNQLGQNIPNAATGPSSIIIPNINITKTQAAKAEQEANLMIKAYYEELELEKQRQEQEAAALTAAAAAQSNQTGGEEAEEAEDTPAETEIGIEEEEEGEEEDEEDNNNEDENNEAEDDDE